MFVDLLLMRRNYLGDRGENEADIQQSENELTDEIKDNEQETIDSEDQPPPLEDIDDSEDEKENETIEPIAKEETKEETKEDDTGRYSSRKKKDYPISYLSDIPFIRPPLQNVVTHSSFDTIFGGSQSIRLFVVFFQTDFFFFYRN
jgi:hypothetical protein